MNRKRKISSGIPARTKHRKTSPDFVQWNRLTKWPEFDRKRAEFRDRNSEARFMVAMNVIHDCMDEEEWFAENTPYPFKFMHSRVSLLAGLLCRYVRKLALANNHDAIRETAEISMKMTETLTDVLNGKIPSFMCDAALVAELNKVPGVKVERQTPTEIIRRLARRMPYWPMLRFKNKAANSEKQFRRFADDLELGEDCPINVSKAANFSLETPINAFVWKCLRHFEEVHSIIKHRLESPTRGRSGRRTPTFEDAVAEIILAKVESPGGRRPGFVGMIKREDLEIYKASIRLPPLRKPTAKLWAETAIVPYVVSNFPNFSEVAAFADILRRDGARTRGEQRREIRKDIIRALTSLARP